MSELAHRHLANVGKPRSDQDLGIYDPEIVVRFPFAPDGHTQRLEGVDAFSQFLSAIGEFTRDHSVHDVFCYAEGDQFCLTYTESSVFRHSGADYSSEIVWLGTMRAGVIVRLAEYYNPLAVLKALGE
jgi:hypothetical protein